MGPLVTNEELADFPGHPFPEQVLDSVAEQVRAIVGWHVAPVIEETVLVRSRGSDVLVLPTLRVVEVIAVEDARTGAEVTGWFNWEDGTVERAGGGFPDAVRVTLKHGYDTCPAALLRPIVDEVKADIAGGRVTSESLASRSVSLQSGGSSLGSDLVAPILARYTIGVRP